MNSTRGNLAVKNSGMSRNSRYSSPGPLRKIIQPVPSHKVQVSKPVKLRVRRVSVQESEQRQNLAREKARQINRQLARRHVKALLSAIAVIAVVAAVYGVVVYRQAMILEANFENIRLERTISSLEQESRQISEALAQKTNLDIIRRRAIEDLGLQDPARSQVVGVYVPDTDRVVYASGNAGIVDQEAYLNNIFTNVEGFFKTMNQQRQVE